MFLNAINKIMFHGHMVGKNKNLRNYQKIINIWAFEKFSFIYQIIIKLRGILKSFEWKGKTWGKQLYDKVYNTNKQTYYPPSI